MLASQHASQVCRRPVHLGCPIPSPVRKAMRVRHRPQAVAKPLVGPGVSKLAAEMEPFAGCNCYYLLVSALRHAGGVMHTQVSSSCRALHEGCKQLCSQQPAWDPTKVRCTCWEFTSRPGRGFYQLYTPPSPRGAFPGPVRSSQTWAVPVSL